jgi:isochorismate synthase EntC
VKIFAGGGIVLGSDVTEEWEETEAKLAAILETII